MRMSAQDPDHGFEECRLGKYLVDRKIRTWKECGRATLSFDRHQTSPNRSFALPIRDCDTCCRGFRRVSDGRLRRRLWSLTIRAGVMVQGIRAFRIYGA